MWREVELVSKRLAHSKRREVAFSGLLNLIRQCFNQYHTRFGDRVPLLLSRDYLVPLTPFSPFGQHALVGNGTEPI